MKKEYTELEIEVVSFDKEDVITTSGIGTVGGPQAGDSGLGIF